MAKLKVRSGGAEVEIDSRDFYVDNQTVGQVIDLVSTHLPEAAPAGEPEPEAGGALDGLPEAEIHESEFSEPVPIGHAEIRSKITALCDSSFFEEPRTASETLAQLRERGWSANLLDVSKELTRMSAERMIRIDSRDRRHYYTSQAAPLIH